jgi:uncharacterized protein YbjT (DUF2867 family)
MTADPRVLVAGATGTVGRAVTRLLHDRGLALRTLSRDARRAQSLSTIAADIRTGDATDLRTFHGALDGIRRVVSCLGAPVTLGSRDRRSFRDVDTVANRNLLHAALDAGVERLVYVAVHVEPGYAETAYIRAHEEVIDDLRRSPISAAVVRCTGIFPIFGPLLDVARRGVIAIPGDGRSLTNPIHQLDVAEVCARALDGDVDDISIGGPDVMMREEIVRLAFAAVGRKPRIVHLPRGLMMASGKAASLFNPRLGELLEFGAKVFTSRCVAPHHGTRRLTEHFSELARRQTRELLSADG